MDFKIEMVECEVFTGTGRRDRIRLDEDCVLNLVSQQKANQADVGADIEEGSFFDVFAQERQAFEIRDTRVKYSRGSLTVRIGAKTETVKKRYDHWTPDQPLPDLPTASEKQATQARVAVGLIVPDRSDNIVQGAY